MQLSGGSRFLPSKRVGALVVVIAAIIASVIIVRADDTPAPAATVATLTAPQQNLNETDTDGDGVPDWEETLWGLNPNATDTDGNGIGDAEEIKQSRDTYASIPGDIVAEATKDSGKVTPLGLAGRLLVSQFLTSKQAGVSYSQDDIRNAAQLALGAQKTQRSYTTYSVSDLTISQASDAAALHVYGNALAISLKNDSGAPVPHELSVIVSFSQSGDQKKFATDMQGVVDRYDAAIKGLLAVPVPSSASDLHLKLANAMGHVRTDLSDIAQVSNDPLIAMQALPAYADDSAAMASSFDSIRAFFTSNGVSFDASEPGYHLMNPEQPQQQ